ncbi:Imm1 family immunity protein [Archangium sp.]|uniref:Imm1 family immunity protein n=1 Tax=Archangium sp. TaxID=1872627 RepID=UPI002D499966|nr:Imm1 family immunity protein [Archangium sp.]HYO58157.1 Imm1 family immunity protein [Archangium sp.]
MTVVKRLIEECWEGVRNLECVRENPDPLDVAQAIRRLDQRRHTLVALEADSEAHMLVGGGNGDYVISATLDGLTFLNLVTAPVHQRDVKVVVGGQDGLYAPHLIIAQDAALKAALTFTERGQLDPRFRWESR